MGGSGWGSGSWNTTSMRMSWPVTCSRRWATMALNSSNASRLVLVQRIALGVAAQVDALAQVVEVHQVLAPEMVEDLQEQTCFSP